jgi:soluble lytic murein transglycosylase-like protein
MRLTRLAILVSLAFFVPSAVRSEYVVLHNGQRLAVTGYQLIGDHYRLQMNGGFAEVPASDVVAIEPEERFAPLPPVETPKESTEPFDELIQAAAKRYSVDADLITSVIAAESNFNPKAISRRNARGLMQLMPQTASTLGVRNVFDPRENIEGGTRYLRDLLQLYRNDLGLTLAAYNAGPQRVQFYGGRIPPYAETVSYVHRVKRTYAQRKSNPVFPMPNKNAPLNALIPNTVIKNDAFRAVPPPANAQLSLDSLK